MPLKLDAEGVVRVGGTRVTLDSVVAAFDQGATAEEIVHRYPALDLADVYAAVSYYLRRRDDVSAYLQYRRQQALAVRARNAALPDMQDIRERLLARSGQAG